MNYLLLDRQWKIASDTGEGEDEVATWDSSSPVIRLEGIIMYELTVSEAIAEMQNYSAKHFTIIALCVYAKIANTKGKAHYDVMNMANGMFIHSLDGLDDGVADKIYEKGYVGNPVQGRRLLGHMLAVEKELMEFFLNRGNFQMMSEDLIAAIFKTEEETEGEFTDAQEFANGVLDTLWNEGYFIK